MPVCICYCFDSIDNRSNTVVAIKIIDLEEAEDEIEDIQQEITVLSQCDSAFVTKYHGSYLKVFVMQAEFASKCKVTLYHTMYTKLDLFNFMLHMLTCLKSL